MDTRDLVKHMILKRLVESIAAEKREKNLPAMDKVADKITEDMGQVIQLMLTDDASRAPKQRPIRGLAT